MARQQPKQAEGDAMARLTPEQYYSYLDFMKVCEELGDNRPEFQEDMF